MTKEKPFIKLLRSPNSGYFFDVNRNEIVAVDDDVYEYLDKEQNNQEENATEATITKVNELKEYGYLSSNKIKEVKHPLLNTLGFFLERRLTKITLQVTQNCNFRCSYCPYSNNDGTQRKHSSKVMSWEIAKKSIDFLLNHSIDSEEINIGFYGGEPLLEFNLIKKSIEYAEQIFDGKKLVFTITTNATLLTNEIIEYFVSHNVDVLISLDGPKEINDKNRVFASSGQGTFDTVLTRINETYQKYANQDKNISVNMVMDPQNDFDDINSIFTNHNVFNKILVRSTIVDDSVNPEKIVFTEKFTCKYEYQKFLAFLHGIHRIEKSKLSPIVHREYTNIENNINKMLPSNNLPNVSAPGGPCVPGKMRLFISVDGTFFPCERVSETSCAMKIGDIENGFILESAKSILNIGSLTSNQCKECWAFNRCNLCAKFADDGYELTSSHKLAFCTSSKDNAENELKKMILLHEARSYYK